MILGWYENLPKEEVPPRHIWWSGALIDQWFEDVEKRRKKKTSKGGSTHDDADEVPSMGNQLAEEAKENLPR